MSCVIKRTLIYAASNFVFSLERRVGGRVNPPPYKHTIMPVEPCRLAQIHVPPVETHGLRRDAAIGVDGMSWREYEEGLLRVTDLRVSLHGGANRAAPSGLHFQNRWQAAPVRHCLSAGQDRIAGSWDLNAVYEEDFPGFSNVFRPRPSRTMRWMG